MKYYIVKIEKQEQYFLASLNSMGDRGVIKEPYKLVLNKKGWFGFINTIVEEKIYLPKGYDVSKEFVEGREYKK